MNERLLETAKQLVKHHHQVETERLCGVHLYEDPGGREIRLLEVIDGSPESEQVLPFRFAPDPDHGVPFPVVIIELSPHEFERMQRGELKLPLGWKEYQDPAWQGFVAELLQARA